MTSQQHPRQGEVQCLGECRSDSLPALWVTEPLVSYRLRFGGSLQSGFLLLLRNQTECCIEITVLFDSLLLSPFPLELGWACDSFGGMMAEVTPYDLKARFTFLTGHLLLEYESLCKRFSDSEAIRACLVL